MTKKLLHPFVGNDSICAVCWNEVDHWIHYGQGNMSNIGNNEQRFTYEQAKDIYKTRLAEAMNSRAERLGSGASDALGNLVDYLESCTNWLTAPASTKYHMSVEGGLLIHSVGVMETAIQLRNLLMPDIYIDSVIICGLFHDVGKVYHGTRTDGTLVPRYLDNILARASGDRKAGERSAVQPYKYNEDEKGPEIALTIKDLLVVNRFMPLSDAEMQALMLADGQYVDENKSMQHKEHPLGLIIHYADYWNGHVIEGGWKAGELRGIMGHTQEQGA